MPGLPKGVRYGGRQKGTPNRATVELTSALQDVLRQACAEVGSEFIDNLTPAQFNRWLAKRAAVAGFPWYAVTLNERIMPYFDRRLEADEDRDINVIVEHVSKPLSVT
jgi:hypothetical protein